MSRGVSIVHKKLNIAFISLIGAMGIVLSLAGFGLVDKSEKSQYEEKFKEVALTYVSFLRETLLTNFQILNSYDAFYHASDYVTREDFDSFTRNLLKEMDGIHAFEWIPHVRGDARKGYGHLAKAEGFPDFQLTEKDTQGNIVPARERGAYFPVYYVQPYEGNEKALGFDLASNPIQLAALEKARDSGEIVASKPIRLVQEEGEQSTFLVFKPIYAKSAPHETVEQRRQNLTGFALAVFRVGDLLEAAISKQELPGGIDIYLFDGVEPSDEDLLYFHPSRIRKSRFKPEPVTALLSGDYASYEISVADRKWRALLKPAPGYSAQRKEWLSWAVLFTGFLLTALLTFFYVSIIGRAAQVEKEVKDRTRELRRAEKDLLIAKRDAEKANHAKSEFLAVMSHELRTPLNAIMGFAQMMEMRAFGPLGDAHYVEYARDINNSGKYLVSLINGILDLSKIEAGKYTLTEETLGVASLIENSMKFIKMQAEAKCILVITELEPDLPKLHVDSRAVIQILSNLLSNAVKFTPQGGDATISAKMDGDGSLVIRIADTGTGMSEPDIARALKPFEQADSKLSRKHEGTGLGLYISCNLMRLHGGTLDIESEEVEGTTATATFPPQRVVSA